MDIRTSIALLGFVVTMLFSAINTVLCNMTWAFLFAFMSFGYLVVLMRMLMGTWKDTHDTRGGVRNG